MLAVLVHVHLDVLAHLAEHRRGLTRRRDETRGLVVALLQVTLERDVAVEQRPSLRDLAVGKIGDDLGDELDHLEVIEVGEVPRALREEEVTGEDRDAGSVQRVNRLRPSSRVAIVEDVVVYERRRVNHLGDLRETPLALGDVVHRHELRGGASDEEDEHRTEALAPRSEDLIGGGEEEWVLAADDVEDVGAHLLHVALHRGDDVVDDVGAHAVLARHDLAVERWGEGKRGALVSRSVWRRRKIFPSRAARVYRLKVFGRARAGRRIGDPERARPAFGG